MKHVRLTLRAPPGTVDPVYDMMTRADHVETVLGLHWNFSGDRLGALHYVEGDREAYVAELSTLGPVLEYDVARQSEAAFYVFNQCVIEGGSKALFETFTRGSLLVVPPIEYGPDGTATFSLFGTSKEIQAALEDVPDPVDVEVREVGGMAGTPGVEGAALSRRQREAVEAAVELGYYDVPRGASHEDVADRIGCAPSTAAEHLRKAESKLVRRLVGGSPRGVTRPAARR